MRYAAIILALLMTQSCGLKKHKSAAQPDVYQIFIKGDPKQLIAGTSSNQESFITTDNAAEFQNFYSAGITLFSEKDLYKKISKKQMNPEDGQEADDGQDIKSEPSLYSFVAQDDEHFQYRDSKNIFHFNFIRKMNSNKLYLNELQTGDGETIPLTALHYSISPDQTKFSLLAIANDSTYGEILISITLYKKNFEVTSHLKTTNQKYLYLAGPGIKSAWTLDAQKQIKMDVCPEVVEALKNQFRDDMSILGITETVMTSMAKTSLENSIQKWDQPFLKNGKQSLIKINYPTICKPFSDVNQNAIYWVNSYLTMPFQELMNYGLTLSHIKSDSGEIFSSDILLLESEINKLALNGAEYKIRGKTQRTIIHEVGHFLGLDHNFEDNSSIMSYKDVNELGNYDESAIYELYRDQLEVNPPEVNGLKDQKTDDYFLYQKLNATSMAN